MSLTAASTGTPVLISPAGPLKSFQDAMSAGKVKAGATIQLQAGGSYGDISIGACPSGLTVESVGHGPKPVVGKVYAYAATGQPAPTGVTFRNLNIKGDGTNEFSCGVAINNGFNGLLLEGLEVSGWGSGVAVQSVDGTRHKNVTARGCYFHDNAAVGSIWGNIDGLVRQDCVWFNNGWWSTSRPRDQLHGDYCQHLNVSKVRTLNCASINNAMNGFRGCGSTIAHCLAVSNSNGFAADDQLVNASFLVAIDSHDPLPANRFGSGMSLDTCSGALVAFCLFAAGRSTANNHAVKFWECKSLTLRNVMVYDWRGDAVAFEGAATPGNRLQNVTFCQPDPADNFINGNAPIPSVWETPGLTMTRTPVVDNRATLPRLWARAGGVDNEDLAQWLAADPRRITETIDWCLEAYL